MVKRTSHVPSPARIDRDWLYQVALPDDLCVDRNFTLILKFFHESALPHVVRQVQAIWPCGKYENFRLHCFADLVTAEAFQRQFGGDMFDPKRDREGGRALGVWHRQGAYHRVLDLGLLSVPEILRS